MINEAPDPTFPFWLLQCRRQDTDVRRLTTVKAQRHKCTVTGWEDNSGKDSSIIFWKRTEKTVTRNNMICPKGSRWASNLGGSEKPQATLELLVGLITRSKVCIHNVYCSPTHPITTGSFYFFFFLSTGSLEAANVFCGEDDEVLDSRWMGPAEDRKEAWTWNGKWRVRLPQRDWTTSSSQAEERILI